MRAFRQIDTLTRKLAKLVHLINKRVGGPSKAKKVYQTFSRTSCLKTQLAIPEKFQVLYSNRIASCQDILVVFVLVSLLTDFRAAKLLPSGST